MNWAVVRVNDDGRFRVVRDGMQPEAAQQQAGRMRDRQTDEDVGEGWNVLALGAADVARRQRSLRPVVSNGTPVLHVPHTEIWLGRVTADYQLVKESA